MHIVYDAYGRATAFEIDEQSYTPAQLGRVVAELNQARADLLRAELVLAALCEGALEQSQSHRDVVDRVETYYGEIFNGLPPLTPEELVRVRRVAQGAISRVRERVAIERDRDEQADGEEHGR